MWVACNSDNKGCSDYDNQLVHAHHSSITVLVPMLTMSGKLWLWKCNVVSVHFWISSSYQYLHYACDQYLWSMVLFLNVASSSSNLLVLSCCCSILYWIISSLSRTVSSRRAVRKRISQDNYHRCPVFITDSLPGLSSRNLLRMWIVAFCQVLSSLSTAAVCAATLSNSALLTHCCSAV